MDKVERSGIPDKDKYVVYHGIEDGAATFSLFDTDYDSDRLVRRVTMAPEDIPDGTEYQDHFWVDHKNGEIAELRSDDELTEQKIAEAQDAMETFRELQERSKRELGEDNGE